MGTAQSTHTTTETKNLPKQGFSLRSASGRKTTHGSVPAEEPKQVSNYQDEADLSVVSSDEESDYETDSDDEEEGMYLG